MHGWTGRPGSLPVGRSRVQRLGGGLVAPKTPEPPAVALHGLDPAVANAIEEASAAVRQSPQSAVAWGRLGMVLEIHEFMPEAAFCFAQAERLDPREPRWPYFQAHGFLKDRLARAIPQLERVVELCDDAAPRLRLVKALQEEGRLDEAEGRLRQVLEREPANPWAELELGRPAYERGRLDESLAHLDRAAAYPPAQKSARLLRLGMYQRRGDPVDDEVHAVGLLPEDASIPDRFVQELHACVVGKKADLLRATNWMDRGRVPDAVRLLGQTVQSYPDAEEAWRLLGRAQLLARDARAAEHALREAARCAPESVEAQFYLGVALAEQGKRSEAVACFRRAVQGKPDFGMAHFNLGQCLRQEGDPAGALQALRAAVRCLPQSAQAHAIQGELLAQQGQFAEAEVSLRQALRLDPADPKLKRQWEEIRMRRTPTPERP